MKRIITLAILVFSMMFGTAFADYPDYFGGNRNLILCGGHMGYGFYLDKSSLVVQEYNPPIYRIAVNVLTVPNADRGNSTRFSVRTATYMYNWDERRMYRVNDDSMRYIPPVGSNAEAGHEFSGEMAFYIAYHMKFYGGRKWYSEMERAYTYPNCGTAIYRRVDNAE